MIKNKENRRDRRKAKIRAKIFGTPIRPRLNVFRSLTGLFAQLIDDENGVTIASVSSKKDATDLSLAGERKGRMAVAYILGKVIAEKAKEKKIETIVFDRAGYKYHGRIKAVAEGARDNGLKF